MAHITLTLEGDPEEVREALRILLGGPEKAEEGTASITGGSSGWLPDEVVDLFGRLSSGARTVLAEVARRPEGYPNLDLQRALGLDGANIGGRLSSVGSSLRRYPGRPPVYVYQGGEYRMATDVARVVRELATQQRSNEGGDR